MSGPSWSILPAWSIVVTKATEWTDGAGVKHSSAHRTVSPRPAWVHAPKPCAVTDPPTLTQQTAHGVCALRGACSARTRTRTTRTRVPVRAYPYASQPLDVFIWVHLHLRLPLVGHTQSLSVESERAEWRRQSRREGQVVMVMVMVMG